MMRTYLKVISTALLVGIWPILLVAQQRSVREIHIPDSSVAKDSDRGLRVHTNFAASLSTNNAYPSAELETPASISCIYNLVSTVAGCPITSTTQTPTGGVGAIAIVDAYHDPNAASDLAVFSNEFNLPAADFSVVYASGSQPSQDSTGAWEFEESLDIEWAHALAPKAKLYLVEAASNSNSDLYKAVSIATNLILAQGGGEVSMSWASKEFSGETAYDGYFTSYGVSYVASAGDTALVPEYPAASPNVIAAGGTSIQRGSSGLVTGEYYWDDSYGGGGGGVSSYESRPSYQAGISSLVGSKRGVPDISAVAESNYDGSVAGVAVYDSNSYEGSVPLWAGAVGTSVSAPVLAARLNTSSIYLNSPSLLTALYTEYASSSLYPKFFKDITSGASSCTTGWDKCTGIGVPLGENNVTVSPTSIDFGSFSGTLACSKRATETVTLTNNTASSLTITKVDFGGADTGAFGVSSACGSTLAVNGTCDLTVSFDAANAAEGTSSAILEIWNSSWTYPAIVSVSADLDENCTDK